MTKKKKKEKKRAVGPIFVSARWIVIGVKNLILTESPSTRLVNSYCKAFTS